MNAPPVSSDIENTIIDIIAKEGSVERDKITPDTTLQELGIHSLDGVQIIFCIEDKFNITVPDDQAQHATSTVRSMIEGIERLVAAKKAAG